MDKREGLKKRNKEAAKRAWLLRQKFRKERRARRNLDKRDTESLGLTTEYAFSNS